ncbi:RibD family protein [Bacteriovoracaceae bacterium]|nr:RibD family protein [Bacteriovoracaceae bacterium]
MLPLSSYCSPKMHRPLVGLKWAQTIDGQMADDQNRSKWISGNEELIYTHQTRSQYDGVCVGASTFLADLSKLTVRNIPIANDFTQPIRVIFDPRNRVDYEDKKLSNVLNESVRPSIIMQTRSSSYSKSSQLFVLNIKESLEKDLGMVRLHQCFENIFHRQLRALMIEGGAKTIALFLEKNLVDMAHISIAPMITGGKKNRIYLNKLLSDAYQFNFIRQFNKGADTVVELVRQQKEEYSER